MSASSSRVAIREGEWAKIGSTERRTSIAWKGGMKVWLGAFHCKLVEDSLVRTTNAEVPSRGVPST